MSLIHFIAAERASRQYVIYLTPEQITKIIRDLYPDTTLSGDKIEVRKSLWYTRDFTILAGPYPTVLKSSWAMSKGMWVLFVFFLVLCLIPGMAFGTVHWITNITFAEDLIHHVNVTSSYSQFHDPHSDRQSYYGQR